MDTDYDALLDDAPEYSDDALEDVLDSVHLTAPVTAKLDEVEVKALSDAEIEALTDELGPSDMERAIARRTPEMQAFLNAKPEDNK